MKQKRNTYYTVLLSFLFAVLFIFSGRCSAEQTYQITETQLSELEAQFLQLSENNKQLLTLLEESKLELEIAKSLSENSSQELMTLREQLKQSQKTIESLTTNLQALKKETEIAKSSLEIANEELRQASIYFKEYEQQRNRREKILETQRNIWQVISVLLVGGLIAK